MKKALYLILTLLLLAASTTAMYFADKIQKDEGNVELIDGTINLPEGKLTYKLYKPVGASASNKAPAVLLLHGYQNDHETCAAYAIELARRGAVVMCLDEYGHGSSTIGLVERGYVNHKVSVNYGNDSVQEGTFTDIKGTVRYRVLMNFSNLSFFNPYYSQDNDGNVITDSSCGGSTAYELLSKMDYVDSSRMAVSGHSMGTWSSWSVAADFANTAIAPKAIVLQCGELFTEDVYNSKEIHFNNVLLLQAKYDEFSYFRDYKLNVTDDLLKTPLRYKFLGTTADQAAWNKTFGSFEDGSARRMELLNTNHRLTTHDLNGLKVALEWFDNALKLPVPVAYDQINAKNKEYLVLGAMLGVLFAMLAFMNFLLQFYLFSDVERELPSQESMMSGSARIKGGLLTILLSGLSFPFMTQLGHALLPLPENIFRMTVGNGFLGWYALLILIMLISNVIRYFRNKKNHISNEKFDFPAFIGSLILALLMVGFVYGVNYVYTLVFDLDLRFIWPFFRPFNLLRLKQFAVYLPVFLIFYFLNNAKIMRDMRTKATYRKGFFGFLATWLHNFVLMAGGVMLIVLLEYIPFFLGIGPGADVCFGSTFGGPFMSILILFVPQVLFFSILCTYCYRKTGKVYVGALVAAMLACWIVTGGSSFL
jgi:dienelactone hydrolase